MKNDKKSQQQQLICELRNEKTKIRQIRIQTTLNQIIKC